MADLDLELPYTGVTIDQQTAITTPIDPPGWEIDLEEEWDRLGLNTDDEIPVSLPVATCFITFDCEDITDGVYWSFQEGGTADYQDWTTYEAGPGDPEDWPGSGIERKYARRGADIRLRPTTFDEDGLPVTNRKTTLYIRNRTAGSTGRIFFTLGQ